MLLTSTLIGLGAIQTLKPVGDLQCAFLCLINPVMPSTGRELSPARPLLLLGHVALKPPAKFRLQIVAGKRVTKIPFPIEALIKKVFILRDFTFYISEPRRLTKGSLRESRLTPWTLPYLSLLRQGISLFSACAPILGRCTLKEKGQKKIYIFNPPLPTPSSLEVEKIEIEVEPLTKKILGMKAFGPDGKQVMSLKCEKFIRVQNRFLPKRMVVRIKNRCLNVKGLYIKTLKGSATECKVPLCDLKIEVEFDIREQDVWVPIRMWAIGPDKVTMFYVRFFNYKINRGIADTLFELPLPQPGRPRLSW